MVYLQHFLLTEWFCIQMLDSMYRCPWTKIAKVLKQCAKDNRLVSAGWYNSTFVYMYNMMQHYKLVVLVIVRVYGVYNLTNLINVNVSSISPEIWLANCFSKHGFDWSELDTKAWG